MKVWKGKNKYEKIPKAAWTFLMLGVFLHVAHFNLKVHWEKK